MELQQQFLTSSVAATNGSTTITVTTKNGGAAVNHGLSIGDMVVFNNFAAGTTGIATDADLEDKVVQVISSTKHNYIYSNNTKRCNSNS